MQKFERPKYKIEQLEEAENHAVFSVSPLERGFGNTLGNALRRVMLSSLPGGAVYSVKIDGVFHEFSSIKGVKEDVTLIILNIKNLILKVTGEESYTLRINAKGPCTVTAKDIHCPAGVEVLNPDLEIAHLDKDGVLDMELKAKTGRGYVSADENKRLYQNSSLGIGTIFTDSIYTPVTLMNYEVSSTRVGQSAKYDALTLDVWTNGSIQPTVAVSLASKILIDHFSLLTELDEEGFESESVMKRMLKQ